MVGGRTVLCRLAAFLLLLLMARGPVTAQGSPTADMVKAAYLYKFSHFVEWPAPGDSLVIGVVGAEPLARELERLASGAQGGGRNIAVRRLRAEDELGDVQMLFIGQMKPVQAAQMLERIRGRPILTVTDSDDFFEKGSMIEFVLIEDKMRFIVATKPVGASALRISALMLAAAYKVMADPL